MAVRHVRAAGTPALDVVVCANRAPGRPGRGFVFPDPGGLVHLPEWIRGHPGYLAGCGSLSRPRASSVAISAQSVAEVAGVFPLRRGRPAERRLRGAGGGADVRRVQPGAVAPLEIAHPTGPLW